MVRRCEAYMKVRKVKMKRLATGAGDPNSVRVGDPNSVRQ
jgi:hypothetical protein